VRGRQLAVWLSISTDLHHDAQGSIRDLACYVNVINTCQAPGLGEPVTGAVQCCTETMNQQPNSSRVSSLLTALPAATLDILQPCSWIWAVLVQGAQGLLARCCQPPSPCHN